MKNMTGTLALRLVRSNLFRFYVQLFSIHQHEPTGAVGPFHELWNINVEVAARFLSYRDLLLQTPLEVVARVSRGPRAMRRVDKGKCQSAARRQPIRQLTYHIKHVARRRIGKHGIS